MIGIRAYNSGVRYGVDRSIDFLVDGVTIKKSDVVIIAEERLDQEYKTAIAQHDERLIELRMLPFHYPFLFLKNLKGTSKVDIWAALWNTLLDVCPLKHYVVYNDFTDLSTVRNGVLGQRGCQTWFYTHACNVANRFVHTLKDIPPKYILNCQILHYDHLIAWNRQIANHYIKCGGKFRNVHVVGCLWGQCNNGVRLTRTTKEGQ